jgi:hypothetical protein
MQYVYLSFPSEYSMQTEDCSYEHWKHWENLSSVTALLCCHDFLRAKYRVNPLPLSLVQPDQREDGGALPL